MMTATPLLLLLLLSAFGAVTSVEQQFVPVQNAEVLQDAMRDPHERPDGEVFSSTFEMSRLLAREAQFSRDLHDYAAELRAQLELVQAALADVYPDGPLAVEEGGAEEYVSHPLNGLGMLRRMGARLKGPKLLPLGDALEAGEGKEDESNGQEGGLGRLNKLAKRMKRNAEFFPDADNYMVGLSGVALLQEAYNINITAMAKGEIRVRRQRFLFSVNSRLSIYEEFSLPF